MSEPNYEKLEQRLGRLDLQLSVRGEHLSDERLAEIAAGSDVSDAEAVHLAGCDECLGVLMALGEGLEDLSTEQPELSLLMTEPPFQRRRVTVTTIALISLAACAMAATGWYVRGEMDPEQAFAASFVISADMVHAVHPNHPEKHEERHAPQINEGLVIKTNANERYATTGETAAMFRAICERADVPVQGFAVRQDMRCGSTIGPITSALLGARTVDVGIPMWGMHSTGETVGALDLGRAVAAFTEHFCGRRA